MRTVLLGVFRTLIVVVDYGVGNFRSLVRGLRQAGAEAAVSADPADVLRAERLVLPGVGSFAHASERLADPSLREALTRRVIEQRTPLLGICLGLELLTCSSEEGGRSGLGWIGGATRRLSGIGDSSKVPMPHLGWNQIRRVRECPLLADLPDEASFYFAHSFHVEPEDPVDIACTTTYGAPFVSVVQRGHIFGTQFHPEKSHANGIGLLRRFLSYA